MRNFQELIKKLEAADGDVQAQAVITADFALTNQPEAEQNSSREALNAASVLRWFDSGLLAQILQVEETEAAKHFRTLSAFSFVERFPSEGDVRNVHDATRLGWRKMLHAEQPEKFRLLSSRAAEVFEARTGATNRIEWIYHLLGADPDRGAAELAQLDQEWSGTARPEEYQRLALTLSELETSGLLSGLGRIEVLLCVAEIRSSRGEITKVAPEARIAGELSQAAGYQRGVARARCLNGDIFVANGDVEAARIAYQENLNLNQMLVSINPSNMECMRELAIAQNRFADLLIATGDLLNAHRIYEQSLSITQRLVAAFPSNPRCLRELATSQTKLGDALLETGDLQGAHRAYEGALKISNRLAQIDASNYAWQRELAISHSKLGDVLSDAGDLHGARSACEEYLSISRRLAAADPSNVSWQRDLAVSQSRFGDVLRASGDLLGARRGYEEYLKIILRLATSDPSNLGWQRELGVSHSKLGDIMMGIGELHSARRAFEEDLKISKRLVLTDPANTSWQRGLAVAWGKLGDVSMGNQDFENARIDYQHSFDITLRLASAHPSNAEWQRGLAVAHLRLGDAWLKQGNWHKAGLEYEEAHRITQLLVAATPANAKTRRELAISHFKLALTLPKPERIDHLHKAKSMFERLVKLSPNQLGWQGEFNAICRALEAVDPSESSQQTKSASTNSANNIRRTTPD